MSVSVYRPTTVLQRVSTFDANTILKADTDDTPEALTVLEDRIIGRLSGGEIAGLTAAQVSTLLGAVLKTDYDAQSVLAAVADNTPIMVALAAHSLLLRGAGDVGAQVIADSEFVGRPAGGALGAMTVAQARAILGELPKISALVTVPGGNGAGSVGTLNVTPVVLVPAVAGKILVPLAVHVWLDFAAAAYDSAAEALSFRHTGGAEIANTVAPGLGDAVADVHRVVPFAVHVPVVNAGIEVYTSGSWYAAAGDSPLKFKVVYLELDYEPAS